MRMSKLVGRRLKENPKNAQLISHQYLIRGGYMRLVSAGVYSLLPLGRRITKKIEDIIRNEMDKIDGQEVLMPVVLPRELWEESGRINNIGDELLQFKDRNYKNMLLAMTHEEAVCHLVRTELNSYKQMPCMVYQIQRKYRDEARPRAGLIRVREFSMKDAYSFHTSENCLKEYYNKVHEVYVNIFNKIGLNDVLSIRSDSGMMGGNVAHEFIALAKDGEDSLFLSPDRAYKANKEVASAAWKFPGGTPLELEKVSTPDKKTIQGVAEYLDINIENTGKAVFYTDSEDNLIYAMVRGDFDVNETKLQNYLGAKELNLASDERIKQAGAEPGFASPIGLDEKIRVVVDRSVAETANLVVGANQPDYHMKNFNQKRDLPNAEITEIATVRIGDPCPVTGEPLQEYRGIEVGNIFNLGTKYSSPMKCNFLDDNGKSQLMQMGCYGIGIGRTMAAVIEQSNDEYGPIWPINIAPYHVHICAINIKQELVKKEADLLYENLQEENIEVLYDDRGEKPGFMFNDADLIGVPFRIIVSPKTLKENRSVEFKRRGQDTSELIKIENIYELLKQKIQEEFKKYRREK